LRAGNQVETVTLGWLSHGKTVTDETKGTVMETTTMSKEAIARANEGGVCDECQTETTTFESVYEVKAIDGSLFLGLCKECSDSEYE